VLGDDASEGAIRDLPARIGGISIADARPEDSCPQQFDLLVFGAGMAVRTGGTIKNVTRRSRQK
jgi:hypothetical protein